MARPRKRRRVCGLPPYKRFGPLNGMDSREVIILKVDEYEVIRLIDFEGLEQEECAERMGVGRSTVQRMYVVARKKMADSLVNGKTLIIEGGDYVVCDLDKDKCSPCFRARHRHGRHRGGRKCGMNKIFDQDEEEV